MLKRIFKLAFILLALPFYLIAQETSSSIGGIVKGPNNEPLVGATITATHLPTGSVYRTLSRVQGVFNINNMQPGGPYRIVFSFVGLSNETKEDVLLPLGEKVNYNIALPDKSGNLTEVVVTARRLGNNGKGGTETSIGRERIAAMPTVNRNLNDFIKYTPQAKVTTDGAGISIAGQNNRYNAFYIDGAINNDVFGLAASGTNGGQANINPISIDAIDQFQVVISPFDASIGGFTGGGINATTRSGTNTVSGSVWAYYRDEHLAGKTPGNVTVRTKLAEFKNQLYGFRIGGPIIKNKMFFFLLAEVQNEARPQPFDFATYRGIGTLDSVNKLVNFLKTTYGYDPGSFLDNPEKVKAKRISTKLDWNLSQGTKLTLSYRYNDGERFNTTASNSTGINFYNNGYIFPTTAHTATAELRSTFKHRSSNRFLLTYTNVLDDRNPIGQPFPRVIITDGSGRYTFGTENFSTANYLLQKNWTLYDAVKINMGKHLLTLGTDNLYSDAKNVFIRDNFGTYSYANMNAFISNQKPTRYQRSFSLLDNKEETTTAAAAAFKYLNLAFFVNDEVRVNDRTTLNFGLRFDKTKFLTTPRKDDFFNDTAIAKISQFYDMHGARSGQITEVPWSISPRIGFIYRIPEENLVIRGGVGMFTGRMPLVWPGGVYNNNGISVGGIDPSTAQINAAASPFFKPDPYNQYKPSDFGISLANAKGQIDLMAKEFKLPKILRGSIGIDKQLGKGWTFSTEAIITKNLEEIYYQNVNFLPPNAVSAGAGSRSVYNSGNGNPANIPMRSTGINPYTGVYILYNKSGQKGFSYTFNVTIDKAFRQGWAVNANWVYGNSLVNNEVTSSQNNSQWNTMEVVNGRNFVTRSTSDFDLGHRFSAFVSKKFSYAKKFATTVSLIYNGQQGAPFSYIYTQSIVGDNGRGAFGDLIYIPTATEIQTMRFNVNTVNGVNYSEPQQRVLLETYIQGNKYLNSHRGQFAERNGDRLPFSHVVDLQIQQDFNIKLSKKTYTLQLSYNVSNFTNMLNKNWGQTYFLNFDQYSLIRFDAFAGAPGDLTPIYKFSPQTGKPWGLSTSVIPGLSARWISQLGLRLNF